MGAQLRFQVWAGHASPKGGQQAGLVQAQQAVHAAQVNGQHGRAGGERVDVPDNAGAAAIGDEVRAGLAGILDQLAQLFASGRVGDPIWKGVDLPAAQGQPIGQALAAGVQQARQGSRIHQGVSGQA